MHRLVTVERFARAAPWACAVRFVAHPGAWARWLVRGATRRWCTSRTERVACVSARGARRQGAASEALAVAVVTRGVSLRIMLKDASRRPAAAKPGHFGSSRVIRPTRCPERGTARSGALGKAFSAASPPIGGPIRARSRTIRAFWGVVQRFAAPRNGACPAPIAAEKYNLDAAIPVRSTLGSHVVWQLHHARALGRQGVGAR